MASLTIHVLIVIAVWLDSDCFYGISCANNYFVVTSCGQACPENVLLL